MSAPAIKGSSRRRRWIARAALGVGVALALVAATLAWGWWVQPSVLVVPLRQAGYWRLGVTLKSVDVGGHA